MGGPAGLEAVCCLAKRRRRKRYTSMTLVTNPGLEAAAMEIADAGTGTQPGLETTAMEMDDAGKGTNPGPTHDDMVFKVA